MEMSQSCVTIKFQSAIHLCRNYVTSTGYYSVIFAATLLYFKVLRRKNQNKKVTKKLIGTSASKTNGRKTIKSNLRCGICND